VIVPVAFVPGAFVPVLMDEPSRRSIVGLRKNAVRKLKAMPVV
jgi:hypothetical protein